jgi:xylulokinase
VCGIDLGTTAVKAALVDEGGAILALERLAAPRIEEPAGTFDAGAYLRVVFAALRRLLRSEAGRAARVEGLCLSSQRATVLLTGADGKPSGPAFSWQGTDCAAAAGRFFDGLGADRFRLITGLPPAPIYSVAKLARLAADEPGRLAGAARILTLHDWVLLNLGAERPLIDRSGASATGLYDLRRQAWSGEILERLGLTAGALPEIVPAGTRAGSSGAGAERRSGLPRGTPLFVGAGDQQCATLGSGAIPGDCVLSLGTAAAVMAPLQELPARTPPGFLLLAHALEGRFQLEGFMNAFGSCADWAAGALRAGGAGGLERLAGAARADGGVVFLPFLAGAGSPDQDPAARGAFVGITLSTSRADLARAVLAGLACEVRRIIDALGEAIPVRRLTVVGGAGGRGLLPELLAGIAGVPLVALGQREAALTGAAALARGGVRGIAAEEAVRGFGIVGDEVEVPASERSALAAAYGRYLGTVAALRGEAGRTEQ